ncbi:MAG: iron-sulfur cluster biosynthesis transcriptional regulator SufR [Oscillatoriales cyanobacterium SM2_2_1]|nr:iron-sulfur cluster biosynthesis transcriptional regulator SufR [Oscillatoriales cyanobacterium SM2_2_1]
MARTGTKGELLRYLLRQGECTAQDLAAALNISSQAVRRHLKDLEAEALIERQESSTQGGMGRPQHFYILSAAGRQQFPDGYQVFAVDVLDVLRETMGSAQVVRVLQHQWHRKALDYRQQLTGPLPQRLERLTRLRQQEGFIAEWFPLESPDRFIYTEYRCAIAQVAESYPEVCRYELEMLGIALDCHVERTHWLAGGEHRCGYLVSTQAAPSTGLEVLAGGQKVG